MSSIAGLVALLLLLLRLWVVVVGDSFPRIAKSARTAATEAAAAPVVVVQVYDEALCIDCQQFILEQLRPAYATLGPGVIDLRMVAFGNAQLDDPTNPESLTCQHGVAECDANSYLQCATALYHPAVYRYFPFVVCLYERLVMGGRRLEPFPAALFAACAQETALDWPALRTCHDDAEWAWQLQLQAWAETLPTQHTYVPWVVIDGEHYDMEESRDDFFNVVCEYYTTKGGTHPACPAGAHAVLAS
jgi:hypothetical protein